MTGAEMLEITARTAGIGLAATLVGLPVGIPLAYWLARRSFPGKSLVQALVALPMVLPPTAVGLILLTLFSEQNAVGKAISHSLGIRIVFTWKAAAVAAAVMAFPLLVRSVEQAFAHVPRRLEQVGETVGLSPWQVFLRITLPLSRRGLAYGCLLCFTRALGEFGATSLLAGNIPGETETLALGIYSRILNGEDREAMALMFVSLGLAIAAMWAGEAYLRDSSKEMRI